MCLHVYVILHIRFHCIHNYCCIFYLFAVCNADEVKQEELSRLAISIKAHWKDVALILAPDLFATGEIRAIAFQNSDSLLVQATTMLEIWRNKLGVNAHRHLLIKALLDLGLRLQANEVFGDETVKQVAPQQ